MHRFSVATWGMVALALVALSVGWQRWGGHLGAGARGKAPAPAALESQREPTQSLPAAPARSAPPPPVNAAAAVSARAETDPYGMPPPSPDQIRPLPERPVATPEDHLATRRAARELVEHGIARLEKEGQAAAQAGDAESARRNELRIARLRQRLATLRQEAAQSP